MPNIQSAEKKLRQDKKRTVLNSAYKLRYQKAAKQVRVKPNAAHVSKAFSLIDKAVKKGVIHKNKASRLKSHLSRVTSGTNG